LKIKKVDNKQGKRNSQSIKLSNVVDGDVDAFIHPSMHS